MIVNLIVFAAGVAVFYKYHKGEVESGNQGLPGLQPLLQFVDAKCGSKIAPVSQSVAPTSTYPDVRPESMAVAKETAATGANQTKPFVPSVFAQPGQSSPCSATPQLSMPTLETNSGEKAGSQTPAAWMPQSGTPQLNANKDFYSDQDKNKATDTLAAAANPASPMATIDKSFYPTFRPLPMKLDEKTPRSLSEKSDDEVSEKEDKKFERKTQRKSR